MSLRVTITNETGDTYVVASAIQHGGNWYLVDVDDAGAEVRADEMLDDADEWDREGQS